MPPRHPGMPMPPRPPPFMQGGPPVSMMGGPPMSMPMSMSAPQKPLFPSAVQVYLKKKIKFWIICSKY